MRKGQRTQAGIRRSVAGANAARARDAAQRRTAFLQALAEDHSYPVAGALAGWRASRAVQVWRECKADLAEIVSQGQSPRYAAVLLGWPARAGVVVWEAICRDVGEPVLP